MKSISIGLVLLLLAAPLAAQQTVVPGPTVALGGGIGFLQADGMSGAGTHTQASIRLLDITPQTYLRGELDYAQGSVSGSPFSCERVESFYCLGRFGEARQFAAGLAAVIEGPWALGPIHPYLVPLGLGIAHQRVSVEESQGPTGICIRDGEIMGCPNNPPFATFRDSERDTYLAASTGLGARVRIGGIGAFLEVHARLFVRSEGGSGYLPVTFGISF